MLTTYSARGQLMCHEDASPDANLMKTVLVLLGYLMPQHKFCKHNYLVMTHVIVDSFWILISFHKFMVYDHVRIIGVLVSP